MTASCERRVGGKAETEKREVRREARCNGISGLIEGRAVGALTTVPGQLWHIWIAVERRSWRGKECR